MSAVWRESKQNGTDLLLLLALADYANERGYSWPSVDTLAEKIRSDRTTVMRCSKRLERAGEVIVQHNRRSGNKYVVTLGVPLEKLCEALVKDVGLDASAASAAVSQAASLREKSQIATNKKKPAKSGKLPPQKSQTATSEVAPVRLDPSVIRQDPETPATANAAAGAEGTDYIPEPPAPTPKPEKKPRKPITINDLADLKFVIAKRAFHYEGGQKISGRDMVRINMVNKALDQRFEAAPPSGEELLAAYSWYVRKPGAPAAPKVPEKVGDMLAEYRSTMKTRTPVHHGKADPNCPRCGGRGVYLPAGRKFGDPDYSKPIVCSCVTERTTHERKQPA